MKLPRIIKRYCPYCKIHTEHKIVESKKRTRGTAHPLSRGSRKRIKARGRMSEGNKGKYSKPPIAKWRMTGKKQSKKVDLRYECQKCKKKHVQAKGFRAKKIEFK